VSFDLEVGAFALGEPEGRGQALSPRHFRDIYAPSRGGNLGIPNLFRVIFGQSRRTLTPPDGGWGSFVEGLVAYDDGRVPPPPEVDGKGVERPPQGGRPLYES